MEGTEDLTSRRCQLQVIRAILICVECPRETPWVSQSQEECEAAPNLPILFPLRSGACPGVSLLVPKLAHSHNNALSNNQQHQEPECQTRQTGCGAESIPKPLVAAMGEGPKSGDRIVTWAQGPTDCSAASQHSLTATCSSIPVPSRPFQQLTRFGDNPVPQQGPGSTHVPGCVSHQPSRHQAGGGRQSTSSSKSMSRQSVMGPSWRLFLGNHSQLMGNPLSLPPCPGQPLWGLRGDPHQPAPPQRHTASHGGGTTHAKSVQGGWARGWMSLGNQHPPSPWQPPHPSWDAARPDDEVISGGQRGRQAGSGDLRGLAGTQTCLPPSRAAPGKPGPPVLDPPHPCTAAGGRLCRSAFGWWCPHGASQSPKIPAVPSKALLAQACSFNPQPGERELSVPTGRATPKTGPWLELKSRGKAGRCLRGRGPPLPAPATPRAPGREPQIIAPTRLTLIRTSRSR